jgi:predicted MFS family arabinose efflux permease
MRRLLVLIYALIFVDEMALLSLVPLVPSYRDALHLSGFESGLLLSSASLAIVFGSIPAGLAGDRLGSRRMTLSAGFVLAVSCLGQGLAPNLWTLIAARLLFGLASSVIWSAGLSWLSDSAGDRPGALGAVMAVAGVGGMVGPVFAGVLADHVDRGAPFLALSALTLVLVVALAAADRGSERQHEHHRLSRILGLVRRDALIGGALTMMVLGGFSDGVVNLVGPAQLSDAGRSASWIGVVLSLAAGLFIVFSALVARAGRAAVTLSVGAACTVLSALVLGPVLASGAALVVASMLLLRAAPLGAMYAITFPLGTRGARRSGIGVGAVNGLLGFAWGGASFAGAIVAGSGVEAAGARAVYALLAGCCILASVALVVLRRR